MRRSITALLEYQSCLLIYELIDALWIWGLNKFLDLLRNIVNECMVSIDHHLILFLSFVQLLLMVLLQKLQLMQSCGLYLLDLFFKGFQELLPKHVWKSTALRLRLWRLRWGFVNFHLEILNLLFELSYLRVMIILHLLQQMILWYILVFKLNMTLVLSSSSSKGICLSLLRSLFDS